MFHAIIRIGYSFDSKRELEKLKKVKMNSSSDLTISSDWDIIDDEMSQLVSSGKKSEEATSEDLKEKEIVQKGSCVDDIIPEQEGNCVQKDADVTGSEINNHQESSSSSEFDVLDEAVEDNQNKLSFIHMEYSISSSLESSHPSLVPEDAEIEADTQGETPQPRPSQEYSMNVHPYLVAVTLSLAFIAIIVASAPFGSFQQMKKRLSALQTENSELKILVQSKLDNDKVLMALEEQIKSLTSENFKLSESMKSLVTQLEEQTIILKEDKERKVQDPYKSEIEKLKEQINILQIDNDELQIQLIRTRYGLFFPHTVDSKEQAMKQKEKEESKDKTDNTENPDNSSDILMEEINELRKKLYAEVEKLKNWKDSVQHLVKKLGNGHVGSSEKEEQNFNSKKASSERLKDSKHDKKSSDWSWGGVKKNLRDTFEGLQDIDVSNVITQYVDKKKIEGVFESVGHYFKKAQEKTKKVLNFDNDVNEEMWNFFGQVRNQWQDVRSKYFQKKYATKQTPPKTEDFKSQYHEPKPKMPNRAEMPDRPDTNDLETDKKSQYRIRHPKLQMPDRGDAHDFETDKKFNRYEKQSKPDLESFPTSPTAENNGMSPEYKEMEEDNSWVFKRAAHRSLLREEEQEAFTNWFLKRGRDFHFNEDESLKEWFKETYQNRNADEE